MERWCVVRVTGRRDGHRRSGTLDIGTIRPETTDWLGADEVKVADVSLRGRPSDLYLFFLGDRPAGPLDIRGDQEMLVRWRGTVGF